MSLKVFDSRAIYQANYINIVLYNTTQMAEYFSLLIKSFLENA